MGWLSDFFRKTREKRRNISKCAQMKATNTDTDTIWYEVNCENKPKYIPISIKDGVDNTMLKNNFKQVFKTDRRGGFADVRQCENYAKNNPGNICGEAIDGSNYCGFYMYEQRKTGDICWVGNMKSADDFKLHKTGRVYPLYATTQTSKDYYDGIVDIKKEIEIDEKKLRDEMGELVEDKLLLESKISGKNENQIVAEKHADVIMNVLKNENKIKKDMIDNELKTKYENANNLVTKMKETINLLDTENYKNNLTIDKHDIDILNENIRQNNKNYNFKDNIILYLNYFVLFLIAMCVFIFGSYLSNKHGKAIRKTFSNVKTSLVESKSNIDANLAKYMV